MELDDLKALIAAEEQAAVGGDNGDLSNERAENLKYYKGDPFGNEEDGLSQVVIHDVAEVVDNLVPSFLRLFTRQERSVVFDAISEEDEERARLETGAVNHVFWKKNPGFLITYTWIKDGLLSKNGFVTCTYDKSPIITREEFTGVAPEALVLLDEDREVEILSQEEREGTVIAELPQPDGTTIQVEVPSPVFDVVVKRTKKYGCIAISPVRPESVIFSNDANLLNFDQIRFIGCQELMRKSDLILMGADKKTVKALPAMDHQGTHDEEDIQRDRYGDDAGEPKVGWPMELVEVLRCYPLVDFDGDGIPERLEVIRAGNKIVLHSEVDRHPFHVWTPEIFPHELIGICPADKAKVFQKLDSTLVRQMLDNLYLANNPEKAIWDEAIGESTIDDLLVARVGGIKRFSRPPADAFSVIQTPFVAGQSFPMLEYIENRKVRRTGVGLDAQGLEDPMQLKHIQQGVADRATDVARMQIEAMAAVFAETGLKGLFLHIHELLQKHHDEKLTFKMAGKWFSTTPNDWASREDLSILVGIGNGTTEQKKADLEAVLATQKMIVEGGGGGLVVSEQNVYEAAMEVVENTTLRDPSRFFTDPSTVERGPDPNQQLIEIQAQLAQTQQQLEERELAIREMEVQLRDERSKEKNLNDMDKIQNSHVQAMTKLELENNQDVPGSAV